MMKMLSKYITSFEVYLNNKLQRLINGQVLSFLNVTFVHKLLSVQCHNLLIHPIFMRTKILRQTEDSASNRTHQIE